MRLIVYEIFLQQKLYSVLDNSVSTLHILDIRFPAVVHAQGPGNVRACSPGRSLLHQSVPREIIPRRVQSNG